MDQESRLARALWIAFLTLLLIVVAVNFAREPFGGSKGVAAVRPAQITLWVPGPEVGGEGMVVAREAAAGLELEGHRTVVKVLASGSSQGVGAFLSRRPPRHGASLLVLTSSTCADLAHDARETLVPGAASQALLASALLRRSGAVGVLAEEPLQLAVPKGSPIDGDPAFIAALRRSPSLHMALSEDSFSRVELASLVARAGQGGTVRFAVHESGAVAVEAAREGEDAVVLAPRGALRSALRAGYLRRLRWPLDGGAAPRSTVTLIAPPDSGAARLARVRGWIRRMTAGRPWRSLQHRDGRSAPGAGAGRLRALPRRALGRAEAQERVAERVEER